MNNVEKKILLELSVTTDGVLILQICQGKGQACSYSVVPKLFLCVSVYIYFFVMFCNSLGLLKMIAKMMVE